MHWELATHATINKAQVTTGEEPFIERALKNLNKEFPLSGAETKL